MVLIPISGDEQAEIEHDSQIRNRRFPASLFQRLLPPPSAQRHECGGRRSFPETSSRRTRFVCGSPAGARRQPRVGHTNRAGGTCQESSEDRVHAPEATEAVLARIPRHARLVVSYKSKGPEWSPPPRRCLHPLPAAATATATTAAAGR